MAIVREKQTIKGNEYIKTYSDENFKIQREDVLYDEAYDPIELAEDRIYVETDIKIEEE